MKNQFHLKNSIKYAIILYKCKERLEKMKEEMKIGVEIERKYIIRMPDMTILAAQPEYTRSDIIQIYIQSEPGVTHRVRRRRYQDRVEYIENKKIRIDSISSTEIETEIDECRFDELAQGILEGTRPVLKTRHTFRLEGQVFEIDVYPEWGATAIMETELHSREERAEIPPFIEVIKEVTGDRSYSNASMSRAFPPEMI